MARLTKRDQVIFSVVSLVLVVMMDMKRKWLIMFTSANATLKPVPPADLVFKPLRKPRAIGTDACAILPLRCSIAAKVPARALMATENPTDNRGWRSSDATAALFALVGGLKPWLSGYLSGVRLLVFSFAYARAKWLCIGLGFGRPTGKGDSTFRARYLLSSATTPGMSADISARWIWPILQQVFENLHRLLAMGARKSGDSGGRFSRSLASVIAVLTPRPNRSSQFLGALGAVGHSSIFQWGCGDSSTASPMAV